MTCMKSRVFNLSIIKDDRAVALTEFAIVIPVLLLFFLMMVQYVVIVQTTQLCNYAAYVAARSYAVHANNPVEGPGVATDLATKAAALALAPVARLAPGELIGVGSSVTGQLPNFPGNHVMEILEGWGTALVRLKNVGSITFATNGSPEQVNVAINYPQPIFIPGLTELWAITGGEKGIHRSLSGLSTGLGSPLRTALAGTEAFEAFEDVNYQLTGNYIIAIGPGFVLPYVDITAKCSMGCENWGSESDYRPRLPQDGEATDSSDPSTDQKLQDLQDAQNQVSADSAAVTSASAQVSTDEKQVYADQQTVASDQKSVDAAQAAYNAAPPNQKAQALSNLNQAQSQLSQAQSQLNQDQSKLNQDQNTYDQAQNTAQNDQNNLNNLTSGSWP
jgi:Flp pilus assembly protein TadG